MHKKWTWSKHTVAFPFPRVRASLLKHTLANQYTTAAATTSPHTILAQDLCCVVAEQRKQTFVSSVREERSSTAIYFCYFPKTKRSDFLIFYLTWLTPSNYHHHHRFLKRLCIHSIYDIYFNTDGGRWRWRKSRRLTHHMKPPAFSKKREFDKLENKV